MKGKDWYRLGIAADTDDVVELSLAIASCGVLEGASGKVDLLRRPGQWEASLAGVMGRSEFVHWRAPGSFQPGSDIEAVSALALARAWKDSVAGLEKPLRIAVEPSPGGARWWGEAATFMQGNHDWPVTSVFTQADLAPQGLHRWPLHIGILPGESSRELAKTLGAISMVRWGLANVSILSRDEADCDVLIAPFPLRELRGRALSYGFMPNANAVVAPSAGLQNMAQRRVLLERLQEDLGTGVVVTGMPFAGLEGRWVNEVVRSLSHRAPLDVALWDADRETRAYVGQGRANLLAPPMIFANPASIRSSPIDVQMADLGVRLTRLESVYSVDRGDDNAATRMLAARELASSFSRWQFASEEGGATDVAKVVAEITSMEANAPGPGPRPPLYADVTFFVAGTRQRVDDLNEPLVVGKDYSLEVALRQVLSGVSHLGAPPKPVPPLPPDQAIKLLVVVQGGEDDFKIDQPTLWLALSADAGKDSDVARFALRPLRNTPAKNDLCCLEIRIYYEFNLLEVLIVRAAVKGKFSSLPEDVLKPTPIFVEQRERVERGYQDLVHRQAPRHLSIDVRREGDLARFTFTAHGEPVPGEDDLALHAQLDLPLSRLMPELNRMRELWEEVAVNLIGASLQASDRVFQDALLRLAGKGRDLWNLLFRGAQGSSMWVIGEWLWSHPAPVGSVIDVRLLDGAEGFAFPWSLLYDRELAAGAKKAEADGFWGIRYAIGQSAIQWDRGDETIVARPASRLEFMLWGSFPNGEEQSQLLKDIEAASKGRLTVQPAITTKPAFNDMVRESDADMLYFYTHGHTRPVAADSGYDPVQRIKQRFEQLTPEQKAASGLQGLYDLITATDFTPDESWIALTLGRLKLQELRAQPMNLRHAPVVFLNMCQSAQVMPGLADSFVTFFLERQARSVLGTECPMTTVFAHPFSEKLLREYFSGRSLGEALRRARQHFMNERNPLGLAYSLFGAATVRYEPALL